MIRAIIGTSRPQFLILAPLCVSVAIAYGAHLGLVMSAIDILLCYLAAVLSHASVNMLNEYQDDRSGLDHCTQRTPFSGGSGTLQKQLHNNKAVKWTALLLLAVTVAIGLYFVWLRGAPLLIIGLLATASVLLYTPWINRSPLLCLIAPGFGFGIAFSLGSFIAVSGHTDLGIAMLSLPIFLLVNNLLLLNQFPDKTADSKFGRNHLIIKYGEIAGRNAYFGNLLLLIGITGILIHRFEFGISGVLLVLPIAAAVGSFVGLNRYLKNHQLQQFIPALASNVVATLSYPVVLCVLLWW